MYRSRLRSSRKSNKFILVTHPTCPPNFVRICRQLFEISCSQADRRWWKHNLHPPSVTEVIRGGRGQGKGDVKLLQLTKALHDHRCHMKIHKSIMHLKAKFSQAGLYVGLILAIMICKVHHIPQLIQEHNKYTHLDDKASMGLEDVEIHRIQKQTTQVHVTTNFMIHLPSFQKSTLLFLLENESVRVKNKWKHQSILLFVCNLYTVKLYLDVAAHSSCLGIL